MALGTGFYTFMLVFSCVLLLLYAFFSIIPLKKYLKRKKPLALYFALSNVCYVIILTVKIIGFIANLQIDGRSPIYLFSFLLDNILMILSAVFLFYFIGEIKEISQRKTQMILIAGSIILIFSLFPFNGWLDPSIGEFRLKYVSQLLMTLFNTVIYTTIIVVFSKDAFRVSEKKRAYLFIIFGSFSMILFFVGMLFIGMLQIESYLFIGIVWSFLALGVVFYFQGFIQPALQGFKRDVIDEIAAE